MDSSAPPDADISMAFIMKKDHIRQLIQAIIRHTPVTLVKAQAELAGKDKAKGVVGKAFINK